MLGQGGRRQRRRSDAGVRGAGAGSAHRARHAGLVACAVTTLALAAPRDLLGGGHDLPAGGDAGRHPGESDQHPRHRRLEHRIGHRHRLDQRLPPRDPVRHTSAAPARASSPSCPSPKARKSTSWCTSKKAPRWKTRSRSGTWGRPKNCCTRPREKPEDQEHYVTEPELKPPKFTVTTADPSLEGDIFTDPIPAPEIHPGKKLLEFEPVGPNGLMILNPEGKMLWWHQFKEEVGVGRSNPSNTKAKRRSRLVAGQGHRSRLRPRRRRDREHRL